MSSRNSPWGTDVVGPIKDCLYNLLIYNQARQVELDYVIQY
jgi:hypothetical protein